mmetsp:Transcript_17702/g.42709  ORF Transcript_17702/g.42709 Transcript_17702/m.42709 type:complete len:392 (+) Transcript_17702:282-1457(+)
MVDSAIEKVQLATISFLQSAEDIALGAAGSVFMPFVNAPQPFVPEGDGFADEDTEARDPTKKKPAVMRKEADNRNKQLREGAFLGTLHLPMEYAGAFANLSDKIRRMRGRLQDLKDQMEAKVPGVDAMTKKEILTGKKDFLLKYAPTKMQKQKDPEKKKNLLEGFFLEILRGKTDVGKIGKEISKLENQLAARRDEYPEAKTAVQDLVEGGADINSVNEDGFTALMLASRNGHLEAVEALLEVPKIDTNKKNSYGSNAMHYAAMYAHREVVQALRRKGRVKKGEKNASGKTPKDLALDEAADILKHKTEIWTNSTYKGGMYKLVTDLGKKDVPDDPIYNAMGIHAPATVDPPKVWKANFWRISKIPDPACKLDDMDEKTFLKRWNRAAKKC